MEATYLGDIELTDETLAHYGVKGMKWKYHKPKVGENASAAYKQLAAMDDDEYTRILSRVKLTKGKGGKSSTAKEKTAKGSAEKKESSGKSSTEKKEETKSEKTTATKQVKTVAPISTNKQTTKENSRINELKDQVDAAEQKRISSKDILDKIRKRRYMQKWVNPSGMNRKTLNRR